MLAGANSEDALRRDQEHLGKMSLSGGVSHRRICTGWAGLDETQPSAKADGRVVSFQQNGSSRRHFETSFAETILDAYQITTTQEKKKRMIMGKHV